MRALWAAARAWLANGASIPLERHAHLPTTPNAVRIAARNLWLCRAGELLSPDGNASARSEALDNELHQFITRGAWVHWSIHASPPDDASELRTALFHVAKANNGDFLSARQIYRVIAKK